MGTEEFKGLMETMRKQLGGRGNTLKQVGKTMSKGGVLNNLGDLKNFRIGKIAANLFISQWEVLDDREAIVDGDKRITYRRMHDRVLALAAGLQALGIKPKDRVGIMLYNCAEYLETFLASSMIGAPMPAVNYHLKGREICDTINLRKPKVLIFDREFLDDINKYKDQITGIEHYIMVGGDPPEGMLSFDGLIEKHKDDKPEPNFIFALNPYTGGTTGTPKSSNFYDGLSYLLSDVAEAPRTSINDYLHYLIIQFAFFDLYGGQEIEDPVSKNIRTLIATPLYHAGTAAGYSPFMMLGGTAVLLKKFDPEKFLALVDKERINWAFTVPTILQRILELPDDVKSKYNLSSMHTLICAAAPCPLQVKENINALFMKQGAKGPVFHEYYGSSETGLITVLVPGDYQEKSGRLSSVGKVRCGDLIIYDEMNEKEAAPGENGLVLVRSVATLSLRYPGMEAKLNESLRHIHGVEWYDDGLIGHIDDDKFLYLTSRVKEMIICGGVNIYPKDMEEVIVKHPKVFDVAVIRGPHPDLGEVPIACVQLKQGEILTPEEIIKHCEEAGLRGFNLPKTVGFYDELPRKIDGKLIKREIEDKYWEGVERIG
jgi:long-chain acyl-CoA synthetase